MTLQGSLELSTLGRRNDGFRAHHFHRLEHLAFGLRGSVFEVPERLLDLLEIRCALVAQEYLLDLVAEASLKEFPEEADPEYAAESDVGRADGQA